MGRCGRAAKGPPEDPREAARATRDPPRTSPEDKPGGTGPPRTHPGPQRNPRGCSGDHQDAPRRPQSISPFIEMRGSMRRGRRRSTKAAPKLRPGHREPARTYPEPWNSAQGSPRPLETLMKPASRLIGDCSIWVIICCASLQKDLFVVGHDLGARNDAPVGSCKIIHMR